MKELPAIVRQLQREPETPHALATLVAVEGSSYRRAGARLLVKAQGASLGSLSGGCLEADVIERAQAVLANGQAQTVLYDTTEENDLVWGVGLGCQGVIRVLIERLPGTTAWVGTLQRNFQMRRETRLQVVWEANDPTRLGTYIAERAATVTQPVAGMFLDNVAPPTRLLIFGAGDDAQPLARMAAELGWCVEVRDPRPAFATVQRFPTAEAVLAAPPDAAADVPLDAWSVAIIMSHRYAFDAALLKALLPRGLRYLGMLGPRKRTERILAELTAAGMVISDDARTRLHAPVGLDLGGDTPETVALSMLAEIQAVLSGRDARPLRERRRPIHG